MGRKRVFVLIACASLAFTACGSEVDHASKPQITHAGGTPAISDALHGAGTPLGDGFTVPVGASLIGAALPDNAATGYPDFETKRAWSALLLVESDAKRVIHALLQQASAKGMTSPSPYLNCSRDECHAGAAIPESTTDLRSIVRLLTIDVSPRASVLMVSYKDFDPSRVFPPVDPPSDQAASPATTPGAVSLPRQGDPIQLAPGACVSLDPCTEEQLHRTEIAVQSGSEPLAPSFCDGCFGSDVMLMRVEDGDRVLASYRAATRQVNAWEGPSTQSTEVRDGWTVTIVNFNNTDTGVHFEFFRRDGSPQYLRLSLANGA